MVNSKAYKVVNASLFSSAYHKREHKYNDEESETQLASFRFITIAEYYSW